MEHGILCSQAASLATWKERQPLEKDVESKPQRAVQIAVPPNGLGWKGESGPRSKSTAWWLEALFVTERLASGSPSQQHPKFLSRNQACLALSTSDRTWDQLSMPEAKGPLPPPLQPGMSTRPSLAISLCPGLRLAGGWSM